MFSLLSHSSAVRMDKIVIYLLSPKCGTSSSRTTSVIMTNEPSNHIDPAVSWTDGATITLESASPFNASASERSHPLCLGMNAAPILWSSADCFGREAHAGNGGALGGPGWLGAGVAAVPTGRPETRGCTDSRG